MNKRTFLFIVICFLFLSFQSHGEDLAPTGISKAVEPYLQGIFEITRFGGNSSVYGTAWIVEKETVKDGLFRYWVLTNAHVVDSDLQQELYYEVSLRIGDQEKATSIKLVGVDHVWDTALLFFESSEILPVLPTAPDTQVVVGDEIVVVGNQLGRGIVQTTGHINAVEKYTSYRMPLIQDDSSAFKGNSGSPIFNKQGQVISMCNSGEHDGEDYSIPIRLVLQSEQVMRQQKGQVLHGSLNDLSYYEMKNSQLKALGLKDENYAYGLFVTETAKTSLIRPGDVLLAFDGEQIKKTAVKKIFATLSMKKAGDTVTHTIFRNGQVIKVPVPVTVSASGQDATYDTGFGFLVKEANNFYRQYWKLNPKTEGLGIEQCENKKDDPNTRDDCWNIGILYKINDTPVKTLDDFIKYVTTNTTFPDFIFQYFERRTFQDGSGDRVGIWKEPNKLYKPTAN